MATVTTEPEPEPADRFSAENESANNGEAQYPNSESCLVAKTSLLIDYPDKLGGYQFFKKTLKQARMVVAPMVDQSELAWRLLSRKHGAELCFTPMLHSVIFCRDERYRRENFATAPADRPLITQFCANDPDKFLAAAKLIEDRCDAIDLNIGCPQMIAKRGHYGAFLQDDWDLLHKLVSTCHRHLKVPITCKMRVFDDVDRTVAYAKMLESAGCQLLTVHGRTREQKGVHTGLADWTKIKAVKEAMRIPVYANGNIQFLSDIHQCIRETGVDGVMSAEGNLHNPALFAEGDHVTWQIAAEYVHLYEQYPCPLSFIRGHLFKIFHHCLHVHLDLRAFLAKAKTTSEFKEFIQMVNDASKADVEKYELDPTSLKCNLPRPYWICQPYERPDPDDPVQKEWRENNKRPLELPANLSASSEQLSKNKIKRLQHNPLKTYNAPVARKFEDCTNCSNPKGQRCLFRLCKKCCRAQNRKLQSDCPGHHLFYNKERRLAYVAAYKKERDQPGVAGDQPVMTGDQSVMTGDQSTNSADSAGACGDQSETVAGETVVPGGILPTLNSNTPPGGGDENPTIMMATTALPMTTKDTTTQDTQPPQTNSITGRLAAS